jgi:hypothetical protein
MDRVSRSAYPTHAAQPSAPPATGTSPASTTDFEKVAKNAIANAVSLGSCFGTMTALNNAVRAMPGTPLGARVVTGLLPSAGVFPTPWVDDAMRGALNTTSTLPNRPSLAHDAVAAASLFLFNFACLRSAAIPKLPPSTPAGMAATVLQSAAASLLAGGASEFTAQWMNESDRRSGQAVETTEHFDNTRKATGRLASQVPAATLQTYIALSGQPLPARLSLLPLCTVTGLWSLRRVLVPPPQSAI